MLAQLRAVRREILQASSLWEELRPGIWSFPVFTGAFCDALESELGHFRASGINRRRVRFVSRASKRCWERSSTFRAEHDESCATDEL